MESGALHSPQLNTSAEKANGCQADQPECQQQTIECADQSQQTPSETKPMFENGVENGNVISGQSGDTTFFSVVGQVPLAVAAVEQATTLYAWAKMKNDYIRIGLERGETLTKDAAAVLAANRIVQTMTNRLRPIDCAAANQLEKLIATYPVFNKSPEEIFETTRRRLQQFTPMADYSASAKEAEGLLRTQLQHSYDTARSATVDLVYAMQDQAQSLIDYGHGMHLEHAATELKKGWERVELFVAEALNGAHGRVKSGATAAKGTIEGSVRAMQSSEVVTLLQQQLESLRGQMDDMIGRVRVSVNAQQLGVAETLKGKVEDTLKAWMPVADHLLAFFMSQQGRHGAVAQTQTEHRQTAEV